MRTWKNLAIAVSILSACSAPPDGEDDPRDESVAISTDGKADAFGYAEGSADAIGILKVANQSILSDLTTKVKITSQAAKKIVATRPFATLTALDAVPYVGKVTFAKLDAYAKANGFVTAPCTPTTCAATATKCGTVADGCGGTLNCGPCVTATDPFQLDSSRPSATRQRLLQPFGAGETDVSGGTFTLTGRTRSACTALTGCSPWVEPSSVSVAYVTYSTENDEYVSTPYTLPTAGSVELKLDSASNLLWIYYNGNDLSIRCEVTDMTPDNLSSPIGNLSDCEVLNDSNNLLWFVGTYLGQPRIDNEVIIEFKGAIYADGSYQIVSQLASDIGTEISGSNDLNQFAITGQLK